MSFAVAHAAAAAIALESTACAIATVALGGLDTELQRAQCSLAVLLWIVSAFAFVGRCVVAVDLGVFQ